MIITESTTEEQLKAATQYVLKNDILPKLVLENNGEKENICANSNSYGYWLNFVCQKN